MKNLTYDIQFNDDQFSNNKGFELSLQDARGYITRNNGTTESYFKDYKDGQVSIICNETSEIVYSTEIH